LRSGQRKTAILHGLLKQRKDLGGHSSWEKVKKKNELLFGVLGSVDKGLMNSNL